MKTLYRNLMFVFRRFRTSTLLNVIGLSVALAVFMVIMLQVYYDRPSMSGYASFRGRMRKNT